VAPTALYALNSESIREQAVQRPMMKAAVGARGYNYSCSFVRAAP